MSLLQRNVFGRQPLGRFLADLNWTNTPRVIAGSVPRHRGDLPLGRFLGLVNWQGAAAPEWPTSEDVDSGAVDQSGLVENIFSGIAWD